MKTRRAATFDVRAFLDSAGITSNAHGSTWDLVFHDVDWVITGCGRSGTKYIAELLTRSGRDIAHESMGRHGIASWMWAVDARSVPWGPAPSLFRHPRERCFHQVREPLAAIASLQTFADPSWQFIAAHTGSAADAPILLRSARYWLEWNRLAEQRSSWRYRIEDIATVYPSLCERVSIDPDARALAEVPRSVNTRKGLYAMVGWDDIARLDEELAAKVREQAREYGYL